MPLDDLGNLVVADSTRNLNKLDLLVGGDLVARWSRRDATALRQIAEHTRWDYAPGRPHRAASVVYRHLSPGAPLWRGRDDLQDLDPTERREILAMLRERATAAVVSS